MRARFLAAALLALAVAVPAAAQQFPGPGQKPHEGSPQLGAPRLGVVQNYGARYVSKVCNGYTLAPRDTGTQIQCSDGSAATITLPAGMPLTFQVAIEQNGAGQITVSAGSGATLHAPHSFTGKTAGQYSIIGLSIDATSTPGAAIYILSGDGA